jgi:septal ring factor EnvC (AmiA/AmiB activator)
MNSERVKKIKKDIEICMKSLNCNGCSHHSQRSGECCRKLTNDILTYINELESENERLKHLREVDNTTMTTLRKSNTELNECMDEMQDRIAELEEHKEKWQRKAINCYKTAKSYGIECIIDSDIDEILKEFMGEK